MPDYKLHVRFGDAEFNAEGPENTVREQFAQFLEAVKAAGIAAPQDPRRPQERERGGAGGPSNPQGSGPVSDEADSAAVLGRVFSADGSTVSLLALPNTEQRTTDALTLLLYGYSVLLNMKSVAAGQLMESARRSGLQMPRVDRFLDQDLILKAGFKRGSRYSLNNPGITKAKELLSRMFE